jgi:hypothetical protein
MTRKSTARLERDARKESAEEQLKNNNCWDELNGIYTSMLGLLAKHASLSQLASDKELIAAIDDKSTLVTNLKILANDLRTLNSELKQIHDQHGDKTGGSTDPDVVFTTINIFEQYNLFMERHQAVVMPIVYHITEQFDQAERKLNALARAEADLKDPNVVSDAIIVSDKDTVVIEAKQLEVEKVETTLGEVITPKGVPAPDFNKLAESFNNLHKVAPKE